MQPVERLEAVFAFEEPDRVPICDKLRNEAVIAHYAGEPFVPVRGMEISLKACRAVLDGTMTLSYPQAEGEHTTPDGFVWRKERWTSWIKERPFQDLVGLSAWVRGEIERLEGFDPHAEGWFSPSSLFPPSPDFDPQEAGYLKARLDHRSQLQGALGDTVFFFNEAKLGLQRAYCQAGLEFFSYLMVDESALVSHWLDAAFRANLRILEAIDPNQIPFRFAHIGEDIAFKTGPLFSPAFLRREFFPRLRDLVGIYHDLGFKVIFHSDGNLNRLMDDLMDTGIDGLDPLETQAGMDLRLLKQEYGQQLVLCGGLDASGVLAFGTEDEVRDATRELLRVGAPGSGHILRSTTQLGPGIPAENVIAALETARGF